jgi:hypothetical protein
MLPFNNLPDNAKVDWFMQPTATTEVHTWTKPVGCNFVYMVAVGAGGGGGAGAAGATGSARGGGASGASGCITKLLVPAFLIPDSLFINVGIGGAGGTPPGGVGVGGAGSGGGSTYISAYRISSATEYLLFASGGGGSNGGQNTGGTSPAGAPSSSITNNILGTIGAWRGESGLAGATGGGAANGNGQPSAFSFNLTGGASGGGTTNANFVGGSITSAFGQVSAITIVAGGAAVASATRGQNDGADGFFIPKRFASYGGGGGGASTLGVGGNGGKGGPGCGGGGGGGGITGNSGAGGRGGDGFVIMISY